LILLIANWYSVQAELRAACVPVWIFHGADDIVPVAESRRMTEAMKQIGAEVHYSEYPGVGHPCWSKAYEEPTLFSWLLARSLPD
jgi:predicted peptidase